MLFECTCFYILSWLIFFHFQCRIKHFLVSLSLCEFITFQYGAFCVFSYISTIFALFFLFPFSFFAIRPPCYCLASYLFFILFSFQFSFFRILFKLKRPFLTIFFHFFFSRLSLSSCSYSSIIRFFTHSCSGRYDMIRNGN